MRSASIDAGGDAHEGARFARASGRFGVRRASPALLTLPLELDPIHFPVEELADVVRLHEDLVEGALQPLLGQLARLDDLTGSLAAWLLPAVNGRAYRLGLGDRAELARSLSSFEGVVRALLAPRQRGELAFVVFCDPLVSLHRLRLEGLDEMGAKPRLVLIQRSVVVEPCAQAHAAIPGHRVTRWLDAQRRPRYAWRPAPPARPSYRALVDRALSLYAPLIAEEISARLDADPDAQPTLYVESSRAEGDTLRVRDGRSSRPETAGSAAIEHAIRSAPRHAIPVCFAIDAFVHLLWLPRGGEPSQALPDELTRRRGTDEPFDAGDAAELPWEREAVESSVLSPFERIGEAILVEDEDVEASLVEIRRLVKLTQAELEAEVLAVGFDPTAETARGPGLRQRVVLAIRRERLARAEPSPASLARPIEQGDHLLTEAALALAREGEVVSAHRHGVDGRRIHVDFRVPGPDALRRVAATMSGIRDELEGGDVPFELGVDLRVADDMDQGVALTFDLTSFSFTLTSDEVLRRIVMAGKCLDVPRNSLRRPGAPDDGPPRLVPKNLTRDYLRRWAGAFGRSEVRPVEAALSESGARVRVATRGASGLRRIAAVVQRANEGLARDGRHVEIVARVVWDREPSLWPDWSLIELTLRGGVLADAEPDARAEDGQKVSAFGWRAPRARAGEPPLPLPEAEPPSGFSRTDLLLLALSVILFSLATYGFLDHPKPRQVGGASRIERPLSPR